MFVAWLFAPLSCLPFTAAFFLYMSMMVALSAGLLYLLGQQLRDVPKPVRRIFLACAALALPSVATIVFGPGRSRRARRVAARPPAAASGRRALAGLLLCLVLVKPHLLVGVALFLLVRREWRTISVLAAVGLPLLVVPALLTGPGTLVDNARELASYPGAGAELPVNAQVMTNGGASSTARRTATGSSSGRRGS